MIANPFHNSGSGFGIYPISGEFLGFFFWALWGWVGYTWSSSCSTLGFGCSTCEVSQWWGRPVMAWENPIQYHLLVPTYLASCIRRRNRPYLGMLLM
jgi:hypothetical protein